MHWHISIFFSHVPTTERWAIQSHQTILSKTSKARDNPSTSCNWCNLLCAKNMMPLATASLWLPRKGKWLAHYIHEIQTMEWIRTLWKNSSRTWSAWYSSSSNSFSGLYEHSSSPLRFRGAEKKGPQAIGRSRGGLTTKIHMIAWDPDHGMIFSLSPGNTSDFTAGMKLIQESSLPASLEYLAMDRGYSSYQTFDICESKSITAVVPPKSNFKHPWLYNKNIYAYRNEIERLFNRLKNYRRIATRYDKLDFIFSSFVHLWIIVRLLNFLC